MEKVDEIVADKSDEVGSRVLDQDEILIEKIVSAQERAKDKIRRQRQKEYSEKAKEDRITISMSMEVGSEWIEFFEKLELEKTILIGRYKPPYGRTTNGSFMRIPWMNEIPHLTYATFFSAGDVSVAVSGRDISLSLGSSVHRTATFLKDKKLNYYVVFDSDEEGLMAAISALCAIKHDVGTLCDALIYYFSKSIKIETGNVDIVGYDDIYDKAYKTLTCDDDRVGTRHVLFAGVPGTGKSMLMKKLIQNRSKDVVVFNIDILTNWSRTIPFLNEITKGTSKKIWVIVDEIDEYGVHRDIAHERTFELLRLLDGVSKNGNVRFIASTNRPHSLDPALLRVGRFGPIFFIEMPTEEQKRTIISYYASKYNASIDIDEIVSASKNGITGCDIRSAFENCIIYNEELTTKNIVKNMKAIRTAVQQADKSYV